MSSPIREINTYDITLRFGEGINATVKLTVVGLDEHGEAMAMTEAVKPAEFVEATADEDAEESADEYADEYADEDE